MRSGKILTQRATPRLSLPILLCAVIPTISAFATAGSVLAQAPDSPVTDRVPATIALLDEVVGAREGAVILRRSDEHPHDVVLIARREANAELLSAAVLTLLVTRDLLGDVPETDARIPVLRTKGPQAWRSRIVPRLGLLLGKLRSTEPALLSGVGEVPSVTVWLPAAYDMRLERASVDGTSSGES